MWSCCSFCEVPNIIILRVTRGLKYIGCLRHLNVSEDCGSSNSITVVVFVLIGISITIIVVVTAVAIIVIIVVIVVGASIAIIVLGDGSKFILKV